MAGVYRDGLTERAKAISTLIERLGARAADLDRGALPASLRRELQMLERRLREPPRDIAGVQRHEADLDRYAVALEAAETLADEMAHDAPRRRRQRRLALGLATVTVVPTVAVFVVGARQVAQACAEVDPDAQPNLAAVVSASAPVCRYVTDADCAGKTACEVDGACHAEDGRCVVRDDADCQRSEGCTVRGACSSFEMDGERRCVALSDEDCRDSKWCGNAGRHGACMAYLGECMVETPEVCRYADPCILRGQCTSLKDGSCIAASDEDCRYSAGCLHDGRCKAHEGVCTVTDWGCMGASACREHGRCKADGGICVSTDPAIVR